jgi:hypothetical protein
MDICTAPADPFRNPASTGLIDHACTHIFSLMTRSRRKLGTMDA